jgi:hypothetical protein
MYEYSCSAQSVHLCPSPFSVPRAISSSLLLLMKLKLNLIIYITYSTLFILSEIFAISVIYMSWNTLWLWRMTQTHTAFLVIQLSWTTLRNELGLRTLISRPAKRSDLYVITLIAETSSFKAAILFMRHNPSTLHSTFVAMIYLKWHYFMMEFVGKLCLQQLKLEDRNFQSMKKFLLMMQIFKCVCLWICNIETAWLTAWLHKLNSNKTTERLTISFKGIIFWPR